MIAFANAFFIAPKGFFGQKKKNGCRFIRSKLPPTKGLDHLKQIRRVAQDAGKGTPWISLQIARFYTYTQIHTHTLYPAVTDKQKGSLSFEKDQKATKLDILLCQESALSSENLVQLLKEAGLNALPRIHGVPKYPPLTRLQFEVWKMAWPITFRDDMNR